MAFADLLLDFFGNAFNGRVQVALAVFGEKVGAADAEAQGATELFFGTRVWSCSSVTRASTAQRS